MKRLLIILSLFTIFCFPQGKTTTPYDTTGWDLSAARSKFYKFYIHRLLSNPGGRINLNTQKMDSLFNELIVLTDTTQLVIENDTLKFAPDFIKKIIDSTYVINTIDSVNSIKFLPKTTPPVYKEGLIFYDKPNRSLTFYDDRIGTSLQIGQEMIVRVINTGASTINNGNVVTFSGWNGKFAKVIKANTKYDSTSTIVAMATENISVGDSGKATVFGVVRGLNTSAYNEGQTVYIDTVAGGWNVSKPLGRYNQVPIGFIMRKHSTEGMIYIYTGLGSSVSPAVGSMYAYNKTEAFTATANIPFKLAKSPSLFTANSNVSYGMTIANDSVTVKKGGIYTIHISVSGSGSPGNSWRLFYKKTGVTDTKYESRWKTATTDEGNLNMFICEQFNVNDRISFWMVSDGNGTFTVKSSNIVIEQVR